MTTQQVPGTLKGWVELRGEDEEAVWRDVWQQNVYQLGEEHLSGAAVIDVGSNIGLFTAFALHNGARLVVAVDPIDEHHERSRMLIGDRDDVVRITAACGDGRDMARGPGVGPCQTMIDPRSEVIVDGAHRYITTVTDSTVGGTTLDSLVELASGRAGRKVPIIVKVDCEGCEYDLILSASDATLERVWRFTMEWHGMMGAVRETAAGRVGQMLERLLATHSIASYGDPNHGGMLYAYRY